MKATNPCLVIYNGLILTCHILHKLDLFLRFPIRLMCGLIERVSSSVSCSTPSSTQFYELRFMFLMTALRPELSTQLKQVTSSHMLQSHSCCAPPRNCLFSSRREGFPSSQQPWRAAWRCSGKTRMSVHWTHRHNPSLWKPLSVSQRSSKFSSTLPTAPTSRTQLRCVS